ncbi:MAG: 2-oxoacid:acceptor oxidoreductase family protein [Candidatus Omnitrophica bacterium]|nr:2-oxoacid:acceptor oxidoreductase family protein [Candidatus Omnitrophota bacterium]
MDTRFIQKSGVQVFNGTELLLKGALEGGASLLTGYPGSPVADFFNLGKSVEELLKEKGIIFQISNNEALGVARLNGSQMSDIRAMCVMKSVGLHVASDGLALGNMAKSGHKGGAVVVVGDDPWSDSTQVPSDSRYLAQHLFTPIFEPATFQEMKDWIRHGFEASRQADLYIIYLVTTNLADGGGTVECAPNIYPSINTRDRITIPTDKIPVEETVILPPRTTQREETLKERYQSLHKYVRSNSLDKILYRPAHGKKRRFGFVASGLSYSYLEHALREMAVTGSVPILKLGLTFPIDPQIVLEFAREVEDIIVIEEKRDFLEEQVARILKDAYQRQSDLAVNKVWGKRFPDSLTGIPETRGLNVSLIIDRLVPLFRWMKDSDTPKMEEVWNREIDLMHQTARFQVQIPHRSPTFCPGCPHRDSSSVFLEVKRDFMNAAYMKKKHKMGTVDLVFHGDTGCYTMLMFEPNKPLMHNYSGMGLGAGTGAGIDPFIQNKQVVFMGDSTFFHSGMIAISDALKHGQDITIVILDNDTTAMTGHQPHPGVAEDVVGHSTFRQNIEEVVKGMSKNGHVPLYRVNPAYRETYRSLIEDTVLKKGVKVVIADKECGITYDRKVTRAERETMKEIGFLPEKTFVNITPEVCEYCLECTRATGCPGLTIEETHYGPKLVTDLSLCKSDGACHRIKACPSFEEIKVIRKRKPVRAIDSIDFSGLPEAERRTFDKGWSAYLAGVGGMGIGLVTAILVRAGMRQGYRVHFVDKKGLAIRNGGVYSHVTYTRMGNGIISPVIPYGKADLLLGMDILESVRSLDPSLNQRIGSPEHTVAIINTEKTPTVTMLLGTEDFLPSELEDMIRRATRSTAYFGANVSEVAQRMLGNTIYVNMMLLGAAYQKGELPVDYKNLEWAIQMSLPKSALDDNIKALNLGRKIAIAPAEFAPESRWATYSAMLEDKVGILSHKVFSGKRLAAEYKQRVEELVDFMKLDDETNLAIALRSYDLIQFDNLAYAQKYLDRIKSVYIKDHIEGGYRATKSVIRNLAKVMLIKDEVYVAHLLTSVEKHRRDLERYGIDPKRGDKAVYTHINRPQFTILGIDIEWNMRTKDWMLGMMKHMKFLRKLLPAWHAREKEFLSWYLHLVDSLSLAGELPYEAYVRVFEVPEEVRGYRKVRYPKMEEARRKAEAILTGSQNATQRAFPPMIRELRVLN